MRAATAYEEMRAQWQQANQELSDALRTLIERIAQVEARNEALVEALGDIVAVASGEKEAAMDDTEGMAWIDRFARAAIAAQKEMK